MRIALGIEYDGNPYHGWQSQPGLHTVQTHLEQAIAEVANHPITVHAAGRTDTGVHATGQVIHFETTAERSERSWIFGTNHNLPNNISVTWAKVVANDFHARFSALSRRYYYLVYNHSLRPSIMRQGVTWHFRPLDVDRMQQGASYLLGEHDFTSFRALECQARSAVREIYEIKLFRRGDFVVLTVKANGFLHHMVRNIMGVLFSVGNGYRTPATVQDILKARNRAHGCATAPPYGLYLTDVEYLPQFRIPEPRLPLFLSFFR